MKINFIYFQCKNYENGQATGTLCHPLCITNDITSFKCQSSANDKEITFTAKLKNTPLIFKSALTTDPLHWFDNGVLTYPTEVEFLATIKAIAKKKLNLTISNQIAKKLSLLRITEEQNKSKRNKEMDDLWILLQDNEYLLSKIYEDKDIFPNVLGTCDTIFAMEHLNPLENIPTYLTISNNKEDWGKNLRLAVLFVELIEKLDEDFTEPHHICDVRIENFASSEELNKIKIINFNYIYPKSILKKIFENKPCDKNEDCKLLDCRSHCNENTKKCSDVINNNLQIICEKIFLGWRLSGKVLIPGLLISPHTPAELAGILRQCGDRENLMKTSQWTSNSEIRKRLYRVLIDIEQIVNTELIV